MGVLCTFGRSFVERSNFSDTVVEVLTSETQYHLIVSSHRALKVDSFSGNSRLDSISNIHSTCFIHLLLGLFHNLSKLLHIPCR